MISREFMVKTCLNFFNFLVFRVNYPVSYFVIICKFFKLFVVVYSWEVFSRQELASISNISIQVDDVLIGS